jgi:hypothetical protein
MNHTTTTAATGVGKRALMCTASTTRTNHQYIHGGLTIKNCGKRKQ